MSGEGGGNAALGWALIRLGYDTNLWAPGDVTVVSVCACPRTWAHRADCGKGSTP